MFNEHPKKLYLRLYHLWWKVKLSTSGIYYIPSDENLTGLKKYIDTLPNVEDPEVFGMHENTNVAFEQQES